MKRRFQLLDGSEHDASGEYEEVAPPHRLVMTWQWRDEREVTRIEITLREIPAGTELTFTHGGFADQDNADGHRKGWNGSLDKLVASARARAATVAS